MKTYVVVQILLFICLVCVSGQRVRRRRRCFQSKEIGVCRARKLVTRYYFNQETGSCEEFIYGGCRGNRNNFFSLDRCRRACEQEYNQEFLNRGNGLDGQDGHDGQDGQGGLSLSGLDGRGGRRGTGGRSGRRGMGGRGGSVGRTRNSEIGGVENIMCQDNQDSSHNVPLNGGREDNGGHGGIDGGGGKAN
ncbi:unnamed protein product [Mytilus coruscus]|uniref:BPTI/Kunitz inhibitor domain-containing protein n=1 Tax=Mytilus coruscus TaxID=42192 RepID=A0A6J8BST3_MYTCO|nr:unnamed protein product [Mytilus coruscus]